VCSSDLLIGASIALGLARAGYQVSLIEQNVPRLNSGASGYDPRTVAVSPHSKKLLAILKKEKDGIACIIEDDGIGINKSKMQPKNKKHHTSSGMRLTEERLDIINAGKSNGKNSIFVSVVDLSEIEPKSSGTRVKLNIPLKTN